MPELTRHYVALFDSNGALVTSGQFSDEESARVYRESVEKLAKEIGGRVESTVREDER